MKKIFALLLIVFSAGLVACGRSSSDSTIIQWRGDRTGIFHETGLMTSWPEGGPELLWYFDGLGYGYSSPVIANGKIFINGMNGETAMGSIFVFDLNGNLLKQREYGLEWNRSYPGARGTIAPSNDKLYLLSGRGVVYCFDQNTLNLVWSRDLREDFNASSFGFTESPLPVGNKIIVTPGDTQYNMIALDKNTGELIWSTPGKGGRPTFCSAIFIDNYDVPLIVQMTGEYTIGIHADTGELLWAYPNTRDEGHANSPLYSNGMILLTTGRGHGSFMLRLLDGGRSVEEVWTSTLPDNRVGGVVKIGNYFYTSGHNNRYWFCVNWYTGEVMWQESGRAGITIAADGMLYMYTMRGEMKLVQPTPERFDIVSRFYITKGTNEHVAHPIIYNGVLYVRRGNTLMAFNIKK